jgi:tetratricopeptide (TPR) repeat protein
LKADIFLCQEDYTYALKTYQKLFKFDAPVAHIRGRIKFGNLCLFKGKLKEAQEEFREGIGLAREAGEIGWEVFFNRRIAYTFQKMGNLEEAMKELEEAWKLAVEEGDFDDKMFTLYKKGVVQSKMGLMDEAQKIAVELKALIESGLNRKLMRFYHHLVGMIEFERGNYSQAIEYFSQALSLFSYSPLTRRSDFIESLALAFYESGDIEKAKKEYEKITRLTTGKRGRGDIYAKSFYMLGKINEEQNKSANSIEHYEKFLDLWKNADPGIAEVDDARERLAGLR